MLFGSTQSGFGQTLQGTIRDKDSNQPLPGVTIYIPDTRSGTVSDLDGKYEITNLPKKSLLIQVRLLGYSTISKTIDLNLSNKVDFFLQVTAIEKNEVVVTGSAFTTDVKRTSVSVSAIDKMKILSAGSDNLVQSLANTPGLAAISTGNAISKPVIRGLGFNRVVVVNEGIRQEGQQWGGEHGLEIDQFSADRIEILKGPSSLLYGSDAIGGVINILEPILPLPGKIRAEINSQYSSNNGLTANSLMTEGNISGFTWRGRGSFKSASNFRTPTERIYNSAYNERSSDFLVGLHKNWGYSHIHASRWFSSLGLTDGARDSISGKLLDDEGNIPSDDQLSSRKLTTPFQEIEHSKVSVVNNIIVGKSQFRVNAGLQQNERKEFEESSITPGLNLKLRTLSYDIKYYFPEKNNFEAALGISGMNQLNENKGTEFLIPDYESADFGIFSSVKKSYEKTTLNAGLRFDTRTVESKELLLDSTIIFSSFKKKYSNISFSVGVTHELWKNFHLKANVGRGFRAPNLPELASNGVHEGTQRFERGNSALKPETSMQFDLGIQYEKKMLEFSLNLFLNNIDNYIYSQNQNNQVQAVDGTDYPLYNYIQGQSTLTGGEFTLDIHPVTNLHIENSFSYVRGQNQATGNPLPFIPPFKIVNELKYEFTRNHDHRFQDLYLYLELVSSLSQNRTDPFESRTQGYTLTNVGLGSKVRLGKEKASFFVKASNIFNSSYYDHLSRMKDISVHGTGRNFSIGMLIPIGIK